MTSRVHALSSCIKPLSVCVETSLHLFFFFFYFLAEAAVFSGGFVPLLCGPLQALQRVLCKPHQSPAGPKER